MNNRFILGFTCWQDILTTIVGKAVVVKNIISFLLVAIIGIAGWICNDANVILLLFGLMIADWATGVMKAYKNRVVSSYKLPRAAFNMFARFMMVAMAYRIGVLWPVLSFLHLHDALLIYFVLTEFLSITENLHAIDSRIVSDKLMQYLQSAADADAVVARYMKQFAPKEEVVADPTVVAPEPTDEHDNRCEQETPTAVIEGATNE